MRSFLALPCPPEAFPELAGVLAELPARDWRLVAVGQRHLTLRFLGEQPEGRLRAVVERLGPGLARWRAFRLEFAGLGVFPAVARPEVLWAGCTGDGAAALRALAAEVEAGLAALGLPPEPRRFQPHLTLARRRAEAAPARAAATARAVCSAGAGRRWGAVDVSAAVLFRSDLGPAGARHTPLARLSLASADWNDTP